MDTSRDPPGGTGPDPLRSGLALLADGRWARARGELARAARRRDAGGRWAGQALVQGFLSRGEAGAAEGYLRRALAGSPEALDHALGVLRRLTGRPAEARRHLLRAGTSGDAGLPSRIEIACLHAAGGDPDGASRELDRCALRARDAGDAWSLAAASMHAATLDLRRWRLRRARTTLGEVVALRRTLGDRFGLATALTNLGVVETESADHAAALRSFAEAARAWESIGHPAGLAASLNGLGRCRLELGDPDEAARAFRRALRLYRRSASPVDRLHEATVRLNLALVTRQVRGEVRDALDHLTAAMSIYEEVGDASALGLAHAALAEFWTRRDETGRALEALREWDARALRADRKTALKLEVERSRAHLAAGNVPAALEAARRAVARARGFEATADRLALQALDARLVLGRALAASGERPAARRALLAARRVVDALLARLPSSALRMGLLAFVRIVDDELMHFALSAPRGGARRAWTVARGVKARELAASRPGSARRPAPDLVAELREVEAQVRHLVAAQASPARTRRRLRALRKRHVELTERLATATRARPEAGLGPRALGRLLGKRGALVEYHVGERSTVAFVVHGGRVTAVELALPERRCAALVRRLVAPLREAGRRSEPGAQLLSFDVESCRSGMRRLMAPALAVLPATVDRLIVIPDGPLHELPFDLLAWPADDRVAGACDPLVAHAAARTLADTHVVATAPSSLLLRARRPAGRGGRVLVLACSPPEPTRLELADGTIHVRPLPGAIAEADAVAAAHPDATVLAGTEATGARYLELAPSARLVHVAAHALADPLAPGLSGVVVRSDTGPERLDLLTAERIASTRTAAELVVLSACDTGRGRIVGREGLLGLSRAFLEAGAQAVIATLWPVDDDAALVLATELHRELAAGAPPPLALARARRRLRGRPGRGRGHPFFWAPFALMDLGLDDG